MSNERRGWREGEEGPDERRVQASACVAEVRCLTVMRDCVQRERKKSEGAEKKKKKKKKKRRAVSSEDDDGAGSPEPEPEEEEEEEEGQAAAEDGQSPKKRARKDKKAKKERTKKKKKSKQADSDDADEPEREATPEPDAGDVTGRITFLLTRLIRQADLNMITTRICKDHIRASFEDGDAVCNEHKDLIKETIGKLINERAGQ